MKLTDKYNLQVINPKLAKEWHPTKNGSLTPKDVAPYSSKRVWWHCKHGHEWESLIKNRNNGSGCPTCWGKNDDKNYNLETVNPVLAREWHPTKNGTLTPKDVKPKSNKRVWWHCKNGHEWESIINNRSLGFGCPYCSGYYVSKDNNLKKINPKLSKEWHPTKNGDLKPENVTPFSNRKVWWECQKGHEWKAQILSRNNGSGCPYCSGFYASKDYNLKIINPKIAKEWHPTKNGDLKPENVTPHSGKKVWWLCKNGHERQDLVYLRNKYNGCPACSILYVSLKKINPELANEWHTTKNGNLTPADVRPKSNKKVWWLCKEGHEWQDIIALRQYGAGCPYCRKIYLRDVHNLEKSNPKLAKQWHPKKNGNLTPKDVAPKSGKKAWWLCERGHEWKAVVANRSNNCPYCTGHYHSKDHNFKKVNPKLSEEWNYEKNSNLRPEDVSPKSGIKVWWICSEGHEWEATVANRANGNGCPVCYLNNRKRKS